MTLSKSEHNTVSETSFLSIRIQNTTRLHTPQSTVVTTNGTAARNCLSSLYNGPHLLSSCADLIYILYM
jgi:hypothetical protein